MDLTGKMFRNSIRVLRVNGIFERPTGGYNCSFLDKGSCGYSVAHSARYREESIMKYFSECPTTDIISKAEHMLSMNYIACYSTINNIEYIEHSDYSVRVLSCGIIIKGPYTANIFKASMYLESTIVIYGDINLYKPITKEDYYKILDKVKKLKEDLDDLWI